MKINQFFLKFFCVVFSIFFLQAQNASYADFNRKEEDAFYVAVKAYEDGFYDISLSLFDRFLKTYLDSNNKIEAHIYIGQCYFFQEKYLKALDEFEPLLKMPEAQGLRDRVLFWLGEIYAKGRDYNHAAEFYNGLIKNYKDSFYFKSAHASLAATYFNEGEFKKAIEVYRSILSQFEDLQLRQEAFFGLCESLYRIRDYAGLRREIKDFISTYPDSEMLYRAYLYLAEANFYLGQYEGAIEAYRRAQEVSSDEDEIQVAQLGMGWSYLKLKRFNEAKEIFSLFPSEKQHLGVILGKAVLKTGLGEYEESLEHFQKVISSDSNGEYAPLAFFGKAEALYNLSRFDEAIIAYRTSLDKLRVTAGVYAQAQELMDKIYYGLAWSYLKIGDFQSAIMSFQKVASLSSDKIFKVSALCQLADTYQDAGDYEKAIEAYRTFLKDYPDSVYNDYIQYQIGMTLLKMENADSAILAFRKLLKDYPSSKLIDDANYFLGVTYFQKGDFSASKEQLEKFMTVFKDSSYRPQAIFLLGEVLVNLREWKAAIGVFKKVIREFSGQESLRQKAEYEIANVYKQMGKDEEANKMLSDFIARYPDSPMSADIIFWLGQSYFEKKNFSSARRYFERLIRNYPGHELIGDAFLYIALIFLEEDNQESALRNLQQARDTASIGIQAKSFMVSGDVYFARSDLENALKNYQQAASLNTTWRKAAYLKMAAVYRRRRAFTDAISTLEKALALEGPGANAEIQFAIAELSEELGSNDEALQAYLKVFYLYPKNTTWAVKALLRVAGIYENKENWKELENILEKIAGYNVNEANYAREKLLWLRESKLKR